MSSSLTIDHKSIPSALRRRSQWVLWKYVERDGDDKPTKVPYQINGRRASVSSSSTWGAFKDVKLAYDALDDGYAGIAYILAENDPYTGIDLDNVVGEDGNVELWAREIAERLSSYTEISPSGKGLRIFIKGQKPGPRCRTGSRPGFEVYDGKRLLTLTGNRLPDTPETIEERQDELEELYNEIFPEETRPQVKASPGKSSVEDGELLGKILGSAQAKEFEALWDGDTLGHPSASESDLHFCNILAFWTGRDEGQIDRLFRASGRYRPKWDEKRGRETYGQMTISKAISDTAEVYTPTETGAEAKVITEEELNSLDLATRPRLHNGLEDDHFINQYMAYGSATCDAFPEYHYAGALTLLSAAVARNLVVKLKQERVYPNIWTFSLGPSTISRKSTALGKMEDILKVVCSEKAIPKSFSPEALVEFLSDHPEAYLVKDEVGQLLASMQKSYMADIRDFFCDIYDNKNYDRMLRTSQRKNKGKTKFQIFDPFVVQAYATTNTVFREYTTTLDLTSGWLLRFLFFAPDYKKQSMPFEIETGAEVELYGTVLKRFSDLHKLFRDSMPGTMEIEDDAMKFYQKWQLATENDLINFGDELALSLWGRLQVYALKLAILFTVGKKGYKIGDNVSLAYMQEACRQIEGYFLPVGRSVAEEVGRAEQNNLQNKILGTIERNGGKITRRDLLRAVRVSLKDSTAAIDALVASEDIEVREQPHPRGGKSTIWYIRTGYTNDRHVRHDRINSHDSPHCHVNSEGIPGICKPMETMEPIGTLVQSSDNHSSVEEVKAESTSLARPATATPCPEVLEAVKVRVRKVQELNQQVDPVEIGAWIAQTGKVKRIVSTAEIRGALMELNYRPPANGMGGWKYQTRGFNMPPD